MADTRLFTQSVQTPAKNQAFGSLFLNISMANSLIEPWGRDWAKRDRQLVEFWHTEPFLAASISSIIMTRASLSWQLEGPPKSVSATQRILNASDLGRGWYSMISKLCLDILCTDNGAFLEIIRDKKRPGQKAENAPILGLANLSSIRCIRTGDPYEPVIYIDNAGGLHRLKWYEVITFEEIPTTLDSAIGRQICFVSRVLKAAEILKDVNTYNSEKISGRFAKALHLVGGVSQAEIERIQERAEIDADNRGLTRYLQPIILAALDPNAKVSHKQIDLATMPDAFDFDITMKWYISLIAMAAGGDFQDFAPLPGGDLGTASQSETLHRKSQRKGHALFMKMIETRLQEARVIPPNVTFGFSQQDAAAELEAAEITQTRVETRTSQIASGEINIPVAQQLALEAGDLKQHHLILMGDTVDDTVSVTVQDDERVPDLDQTKAVDIHTAWVAANHISQLIMNSPINSALSLNEHQLEIFRTALRNSIQTEQTIGTDDKWHTVAITQAAKEAGIQPHVIRMCLPDNLKVSVTNDGVYKNGKRIWQKAVQSISTSKVKRSRIAAGAVCFKCGEPKTNYVYIPLKHWQPVCDNHLNQGLVGKAENPQYDLYELLNAFKIQTHNVSSDKKFAIFLASLFCASEIKYGKAKNIDKIKQIAQKTRSTIGIVPSELLTHHILSI